jgi:hypothetical protein
MVSSVNARLSVDSLVDRMFDQVLDQDERAELMVRIRAWEAANPDVDNAHRITGWIDVAYESQARRPVAAGTLSPIRRHLSSVSWSAASATA